MQASSAVAAEAEVTDESGTAGIEGTGGEAPEVDQEEGEEEDDEEEEEEEDELDLEYSYDDEDDDDRADDLHLDIPPWGVRK